MVQKNARFTDTNSDYNKKNVFAVFKICKDL